MILLVTSIYCACLHMGLCSDGDHAYEDHELMAKEVFHGCDGCPPHVKVVQDVRDGVHDPKLLVLVALLDDDDYDAHYEPREVSLELLEWHL